MTQDSSAHDVENAEEVQTLQDDAEGIVHVTQQRSYTTTVSGTYVHRPFSVHYHHLQRRKMQLQESWRRRTGVRCQKGREQKRSTTLGPLLLMRKMSQRRCRMRLVGYLCAVGERWGSMNSSMFACTNLYH